MTPTVDTSTPRTGTIDRTAPSSRSIRRRLATFVESYALLVLLLLCALFFCLWPQTASTFPTLANFRILVASQAVIGVIALGALLPLLVQEFDLSVGAVAGVSAIFVAAYLSDGGNVLIGVLLSVAIGLVVGTINAVLVTRAHVSGVITTLGMSTILGG